MDHDEDKDVPRDDRHPHPALRWVALAEALVAGTALLVIFGLVLTQAVQRYLPVTGWAWTGELAQYCLVWLTFSMIGYLMGRGDHITLQVVDNVKSQAVRRAVMVFANLVVAAISIGFVAEGYQLVTSESGQVSPAMRMPLVWLYVIPLLGFALTAVRALVGVFAPVPAGGSSASPDPV